MQSPRTIAWVGDTYGFVRLLDQTLLPTEVQYRDCHTVEEVWEAIRTLRVRGVPAIGIAAAMGVVLGLQHFQDRSRGATGIACKRSRVISAPAVRPRSTSSGALDRMESRVRGRTEDWPPPSSPRRPYTIDAVVQIRQAHPRGRPKEQSLKLC